MTTAAAASPPPNRTATTENFPVGSWLLPAPLRPTVAVFYRLARAADDIADSATLDAETKTARLKAIDAALVSGAAEGDAPELAYALDLKRHFEERGLSVEHSRHLLQAFMADAVNRPCRSWSDLLAYCRYSANPVGRFLLELHGESRDTWPASDALCTSLQILNHLQDCKDDYAKLTRLYVPLDWLTQAGLTPRALLAAAATPPLRAVLDRVLDGVDQLNQRAAALPRGVANRGLRMESAVIVSVAQRLAAKLRRGDPIAGRVALSKWEKAGALIVGVARGLRR
ncbi:MAG: squalene synthase HpnC [Alphaproteobacteria bacterium]|nr:squalene synthase HpnC [Alphaproteobacteria bacterium]